MNFKFEDFPSERLYKISKRIVDLAFYMGGSRVRYFEAERCTYKFPNGKLCFNPHTLSPSIHCPVCKGSGVVYREPKELRAIAIDQQNKPTKRLEGVQYIDSLRLVVPAEVPVKLVKLESSGRMFYIRDRFDIFDSRNNLWHTVFVASEPKDVWLAGILYKSFQVSSAYLSDRDAIGDEKLDFSGLQKEIENIVGKQTVKTSIVEDVYVKNDQTSSDKEQKTLEEIIKNILGRE